MQGRLFTLVTAEVGTEVHDGIFAWGMEITHQDGCAAVIYRWDPGARQSTQGVHRCAEGARLLYSRAAGMPLALVWMAVPQT